jgi:hypothetical protein
MHEHNEFVRGVFNANDLTNSAQAVFSGGRGVKGVNIQGVGNAATVIFRGTGAGAEYMRITVGIGSRQEFRVPFYAANGLEVLTASAAGDVNITVFYWDD